jgi:general secretion pathway protein D
MINAALPSKAGRLRAIKRLSSSTIRRALLAACMGIAVPSAWAQAAPSEPVTLNFVGAEIESVARAMAVITRRSVVVDPRVKGTINLASEIPVAPLAAWDQFLAALRLQGFAIAESAGVYKIVPESEAKLQTNVVSAGPARLAGNQIVTQIFPLNHENASNLVPVLRPLISPNNTINASPGGNALVVTDYADNLQRISRIIGALDISNAGDVEVITLRHAIASDVAVLVNRLIEGSGSGAASGTPAGGSGGARNAAARTGDGYATTVLADPRTNSVVLRAANPARAALVRTLVERLDQPTAAQASGNIHVVYLKFADATQLAPTLRAALAADATLMGAGSASGATAAGGLGSTGGSTGLSAVNGSGTGAAGGTSSLAGTTGGTAGGANPAGSNLLANAAQPSIGGQIQADPNSNSFIITALEPQYRQIRAVIEMLDTRHAQVYVEALIAEVTADNAADLGVQWLGLASSGSGYVGGGTNFGATGNLFDIAASAALGTTTGYTYGQGLNVGLYRGSLAVLASALETRTNANILSTPTLLTLDNQEAKITIGQNVPVATGSYSTSSGNATVNPFTTYERMDVGLTLNIKPQINADGTIKMMIYQEVSSISGALGSSTTNASNLVTNKRTIASTVLVQEGSTAVLGGLIQDQFDTSNSQVPLLGSIPVVGNLFRSQSRSRTKTNLMVFLRPVILRDNQAMDRLAQDRYETIRDLQAATQPPQSAWLPINRSPVLPAGPSAAFLGPDGTGSVPPPLVAPVDPPPFIQPATPAGGEPARAAPFP